MSLNSRYSPFCHEIRANWVNWCICAIDIGIVEAVDVRFVVNLHAPLCFNPATSKLTTFSSIQRNSSISTSLLASMFSSHLVDMLKQKQIKIILSLNYNVHFKTEEFDKSWKLFFQRQYQLFYSSKNWFF